MSQWNEKSDLHVVGGHKSTVQKLVTNSFQRVSHMTMSHLGPMMRTVTSRTTSDTPGDTATQDDSETLSSWFSS